MRIVYILTLAHIFYIYNRIKETEPTLSANHIGEDPSINCSAIISLQTQERPFGKDLRSLLSSGFVILMLPANSQPAVSISSSIVHNSTLEAVTLSPSPDLVFHGVPFSFQL